MRGWKWKLVLALVTGLGIALGDTIKDLVRERFWADTPTSTESWSPERRHMEICPQTPTYSSGVGCR